MALSVGEVFAKVGFQFDDRGADQWEKRKRQLDREAKDPVRGKGEFKTDQRGFDEYDKQHKRVRRANDDTIKSQGRLRTSFGSVWMKGGAAFAAAGGATAIIAGVKGIIGAYGESEKSNARLQAQLKAQGISYKAHADQIDEVIQKHSKLAGIDDEDLQDAFTAIVRSTGSVTTATKDMALVTDLARAKNMSAEAAGQLVAKMHAGQTRALKALGIEFVASTKHQDALKKSGDKFTPAQMAAAKAADKHADGIRALGLVQDRVRGQGERYGKTQQGALDRVGVAFENLQEKLGEKLAPTITRAANSVAKFIDEMSAGTGAGGRFAHGLGRIADAGKIAYGVFQGFARIVRVVARDVAGTIGDVLGIFQKVFNVAGKLPGPMGAPFRAAAKAAGDAKGSLDKFSKSMDVGIAARDMEGRIDKMRKKVGGDLGTIRKDTDSNIKAIRARLGTSKEGTDLIAKNFDAARKAIRESMRRGVIHEKDGLRELKRLADAELRELGITTLNRAGKGGVSSNAAENARVQANRAGGGWIGARGEVAQDGVPIMAARGEAVLNRHQQGVIEAYLGEGFLDRMFDQIKTPHYMAGGGRIGGRMLRAAAGLQLPEGIHVTHQTAGLAGYPAEDIFGRPGTTVGAPVAGTIARLSGQAGGPGGGGAYGYSIYLNGANGRSYFLTHFGSTNVRAGQKVRRGQVIGTIADYPGGVPDHIHEGVHGGLTGLTLGGPGGAAPPPEWRDIKAPRVGGSGQMQGIVQGRLDRNAAAINRAGRAAANSMGGGGTSGGTGDPATIRAGLRLAGFPATPENVSKIQILMGKESGGSATAVNPTAVGSEHATGIMQMLPSTFRAYMVRGHGNILNAVDNIAASARYQRARYGGLITHSPYAQGGFVEASRGLGSGLGRSAEVIPGTGKDLALAGLVPGVGDLPVSRAKYNLLMRRYRAGDRAAARWAKRMQRRYGRDWNRPAWLYGERRGAHEEGGWVDGYEGGGVIPGVGSVISGRGAYRQNDYRAFVRFMGRHHIRPGSIGSGVTPASYYDLANEWFNPIWSSARTRGRNAPIGYRFKDKFWRGDRRDGGGWVHAAGGKKGKPSKLRKIAGGATADLVRKVSPLQHDRSDSFESMLAHVEAWDEDYGRWERRFNVTEEELVDSETGLVDKAAVKKKAHELAQLIKIRRRIRDELVRAKRFADNIQKTYRHVVASLRKALRHAKGRKKDKQREGIKGYIAQYQRRISEWGDKETEAEDARFDAQTDLMSLRAERKEVLATTSRPADAADTSGDGLGGGDDGGGGGEGGGGETPETPPDELATQTEIGRRAAEQATALAANVRELTAALNVLTGPADVAGARGNTLLNAVLSQAAGSTGGALGAGGFTGVGGGGLLGGGAFAQPAVQINFNSLAPATGQQAQQVADAFIGAVGSRPNAPVTRAPVG